MRFKIEQTKLLRVCLPTLLLCCAPGIAADKVERKATTQRSGDKEFPIIKTKLRYSTLLLMPPGEEIDIVISGDQSYWNIETKGSLVAIKPAKEGATTNLNIVSKNKFVYSFILQEITKPGAQRDEPDLKVQIGAPTPDEVSALREKNEKLEELISRTEKERDKATDDLKKKKLKQSPFRRLLNKPRFTSNRSLAPFGVHRSPR